MSEQAVNGVGVVGYRHAERNNLTVRFVELEAGKVMDSWLPRIVMGGARHPCCTSRICRIQTAKG